MAAKSQKAKIAYLKSDGSEAANVAAGDIATIQFRFVDGLGNLDIDLAAVPSNVANTAMVRGLAEKVRDEYASSESADEAYDWAKSIIERLLGDEWFGEREGGGPSISTFVEAVKATKVERFGLHPQEFPNGYDAEADTPVLMEKYVGKGKAEIRKKALAGNSRLNAIYTKLVADAAAAKALRASEKAAKAAAEAGQAASTGDASSL